MLRLGFVRAGRVARVTYCETATPQLREGPPGPSGNGGTLAGGAIFLWGPERRVAERLGVFAPQHDSQPGPPKNIEHRLLANSDRANRLRTVHVQTRAHAHANTRGPPKRFLVNEGESFQGEGICEGGGFPRKRGL